MDRYSFFMGLATGLACVGLLPLFNALRRWHRLRLDSDEVTLLCAARAVGGRLVFRHDPAAPGTKQLQLRDLPDQAPIENRQQVGRLVLKGFLEPDKFGVPERYLLTSLGWSRVKKLPALTVTVSPRRNWYNSISRRPVRAVKRKES